MKDTGVNESTGMDNVMHAASRKLEVCFMPTWSLNPYHSQLIKNLSTRDVHVAEEGSLRRLTKDIVEGRRRLDVLHLHALPPFRYSPRSVISLWLMYRRLQALRSAGVSLVLTIHDLVPHEAGAIWGDLLVGRLTCRLFDGLIVHSEWARKTLKRSWPSINAERIFVIPHPNFIGCYDNRMSREEARKRLGLQHGQLAFLFLGLIRPYKGVEDLILSFRSLPNPNVRLIIAGKPLTPEFGMQLASKIVGDGRIQFFPEFVPSAEIQRFMNASDVVVFPYRRVFTSGAVLLAMSFGKPCIGTEAGSIEEVLGPDGGILYPGQDPAGLRAALLKAASSESALREMGKRNLERVKRWSWDEMARRTAELYRSMLNDHPDRSSSNHTSLLTGS